METTECRYSPQIVTMWLTKWILEKNLPFSTIEDDGLKFILKKGNLAPPLSSQSIPAYSKVIQQKIIEKVCNHYLFGFKLI